MRDESEDSRRTAFWRVCVTGGRHFEDDALMNSVLLTLDPAVVITGDATGADACARTWAQNHADSCRLEVYYAPWGSAGLSAGSQRNREMLLAGQPDLVVAFPGGRGTANMCRQARAANVPVLRVDQHSWPDVCERIAVQLEGCEGELRAHPDAAPPMSVVEATRNAVEWAVRTFRV